VIKPESLESESFNKGLLEYPQYTRPPEFMGRAVPEILLSGHHGEIEKWRLERALDKTRLIRPDLLDERRSDLDEK
jgi:tRNA (guanine37-N1)-methyltransferase